MRGPHKTAVVRPHAPLLSSPSLPSITLSGPSSRRADEKVERMQGKTDETVKSRFGSCRGANPTAASNPGVLLAFSSRFAFGVSTQSYIDFFFFLWGHICQSSATSQGSSQGCGFFFRDWSYLQGIGNYNYLNTKVIFIIMILHQCTFCETSHS